MYLISLSAGIFLIAMAVFLLSFGRQIYIDLYTGEAHRLGMLLDDIILAILIGFLITLLFYLGYHGIIGKLTIGG